MARPKALLIAPIAPARTGNGLAMRQGMFLEALAMAAETTLLVLPIAGPPSTKGDLASELGVRTINVATAGRADTQFTLLSMMADGDERLAAFRRYGRGSRHARLSYPVMGEIRERLPDDPFDLVHSGRLYVAEAAMPFDAARTLDLDEDDAWAWRRQAEIDRDAGRDEAARWAEAEAEAEARLLDRIGDAFAAIFVAGSADRDGVSARHPKLKPDPVFNGVDFPAFVERRDDGHSLLFVGNLGYPPNVEGLLWFAENVLPMVPTEARIRLRVAGRGVVPSGLRDHPQIEILGEIADVASVYPAATLSIVPMHSGGGTRIKLIEAVARRVPVVSTTIGVQGLDLADDMFWRADSAAAFAGAITEALAYPDEARRRADLAHAHMQASHSRDGIVKSLACRFAAILDKSQANGPRRAR